MSTTKPPTDTASLITAVGDLKTAVNRRSVLFGVGIAAIFAVVVVGLIVIISQFRVNDRQDKADGQIAGLLDKVVQVQGTIIDDRQEARQRSCDSNNEANLRQVALWHGIIDILTDGGKNVRDPDAVQKIEDFVAATYPQNASVACQLVGR